MTEEEQKAADEAAAEAAKATPPAKTEEELAAEAAALENETDADKATRLQKELDLLKKQDTNAGALRKKGEEAKKKHGEEKASLQEQITTLKGQIETGEASKVDEWKETIVGRFVKTDEDKASVQAEYALLNMPETTKEEVNARSVKALKLAGFDIEGDTSALIGPSGGSHEGDATTKTEKQKTREGNLDNALFPHLQKAKEAKQ